MTEREALKLALEALEELNKLSIGEHAICLPAEIDTAMDAIKEALAQTEQEPVAWMIWLHGPAGHFDHKQFAELEFDRRNKEYPDPDRKLLPLYTTPPQRTWVGLTDDDCLEALKAVDPETKRLPLLFSMFAANIQAKLKEKNTWSS